MTFAKTSFFNVNIYIKHPLGTLGHSQACNFIKSFYGQAKMSHLLTEQKFQVFFNLKYKAKKKKENTQKLTQI